MGGGGRGEDGPASGGVLLRLPPDPLPLTPPVLPSRPAQPASSYSTPRPLPTSPPNHPPVPPSSFLPFPSPPTVSSALHSTARALPQAHSTPTPTPLSSLSSPHWPHHFSTHNRSPMARPGPRSQPQTRAPRPTHTHPPLLSPAPPLGPAQHFLLLPAPDRDRAGRALVVGEKRGGQWAPGEARSVQRDGMRRVRREQGLHRPTSPPPSSTHYYPHPQHRHRPRCTASACPSDLVTVNAASLQGVGLPHKCRLLYATPEDALLCRLFPATLLGPILFCSRYETNLSFYPSHDRILIIPPLFFGSLFTTQTNYPPLERKIIG